MHENNANLGHSSTFDAALWWLARGVHVVPLQPNSKRIVSGYGPRSRHIDNEPEAHVWLATRRCNVAIVCDDVTCLDCDSEAEYTALLDAWPEVANTRTERTKRGFHVYVSGFVNPGDVPCEVLGPGRVATVAPSVVDGVPYRVVNEAAILRVNSRRSSLLSETVHSTRATCSNGNAIDTVQRIKQTYRLEDVVQRDGVVLRGVGRWRRGRCPFHDDTQPSLWIDTERQIFGCFGCSMHGDVINWIARRDNLPLGDVIRMLAGTLT